MYKRQAEQLRRVFTGGDERQRLCHLCGGCFKRFHGYALGVVTRGALQDPAGVIDLAEDEPAGVAAALIGIIGHAILRLPQEDVAMLFADGACQKLPARGEKRDVHTALHAGTHQGGTCAGVGETDVYKRQV